MQHRSQSDPEAQVLSEPLATRLLERASQLDAARTGSTAVADLRAAATAAGISRSAFDAALEELQQPVPPSPAATPAAHSRRNRWKIVAGVLFALVAIGSVGVSRAVVPPTAGLMVEETFWLTCLSSGEAAVLIRPMIGQGGQTFAPPSVPRILRVYAPPATIEKVRAELSRLQRSDSPACTIPPGSAKAR